MSFRLYPRRGASASHPERRSTHRPRIRTHDRLISHEGRGPRREAPPPWNPRWRLTVAAAPSQPLRNQEAPAPGWPRGPRMQAWLRNWNRRGLPTSISMMQHLHSTSAFLYPSPLPSSTSHSTPSCAAARQRPSPRPVRSKGASDRRLGPSGHQRGLEPIACINRGSGTSTAAAAGGQLFTRIGLLYSAIRLATATILTHPGSGIGRSPQTPRRAGLVRSGAVCSDAMADCMAPKTDMLCMPIIEEAIFRFDSSEAAKRGAPPSLSFENSKLREKPIDTSCFNGKKPVFIPQCELQNEQQVVTVKLPSGTSFYGTGEIGGASERSGKRVYTWNTDAWGYNQNTTSLYQSHPWVFTVLPTGEAFGVLADTSRRCEIDLRKSTVIRISGVAPFPVITFGPYATPEALMTGLTHAIGMIQMPPKWALGYHQCRWSYLTAKRVAEVASTFREKKIPCDVIWMDIDYMQGFKCFTFDKETFPDPKKLSVELHRLGFKGIWMLDPGIKVEEGYEAYDSGSQLDVWIQTATGKQYVGECWPGPVAFPDFLNEKTREWWAKLVKEFASNGVDGIWNDMNEPAVFKTVSKTMPETNIHRGDEELGGCQSHSHYHNVYGMFQARSTYEGMLLANKEKRPFVLTRASYIGGHRYAATWTGDNLSNWEHLYMSIPMSINLGLSGQPFSGPDVGGFAGDATPKLFARWMGLGAMLPFARGHTEQGTIDQEPWSFGPEVEELSRFALNRRYRFLPHFYNLFRRAHLTGIPVLTPLFFADPKDPKLRNVDDSFLIGSILVSACPTPKKRKDNLHTVLPDGIWHRFHFNDDHPELPLLFLRGGSIVPTGPVIQCVGEANPTDTVTLLVALDKDGMAKGELYEDEGEGFAYKKGDYLLTHYEAKLTKDGEEVVVGVSKSEGQRQRPKRTLCVRLLVGDTTEVAGECLDGEELRLKVPSAADINKSVAANHMLETRNLDRIQGLLDEAYEDHHPLLGVGAVYVPVDLDQGNMLVRVVPWIRGRMFSLIHKPSGYEWMEGRMEYGGYEDITGVDLQSSANPEDFKVVKRELVSMDGQESVGLEGDIGGGLVLARNFVIPKGRENTVRICSAIEARTVGAGSGGFSRLIQLRVFPMFKIVHPLDSLIKYTAIDGTEHEVRAGMEFYETSLTGSARPNGEWTLMDTETDLAVINRFDVDQVETVHYKWGPGNITLELWSKERPVSKDTPLAIHHEYELVDGQNYN